jgi:hypothetical protein
VTLTWSAGLAEAVDLAALFLEVATSEAAGAPTAGHTTRGVIAAT